MKLTTLFRLRKPDGTDPVNIEDFNDNFDVIDEELGKRLESTGAASDMTVAFEQASARTNLKTGEKISVSFGKIMKWFADLKTVAFSGSYNDLTSKPTIPSGAAASQAVANNCTTTAAGSVLDARQGKVLMDKANQLNSETDRINVYVGGDGKLHFVNKAGADSVLNFSSSQMLGTLSPVSYSQNGAAQQRTWQYDIASKYGGYNNITIDNIIAQIMTACGGAVSGPIGISYAYAPSNGRLSLTAAMQTFNDNASYPTLKVVILR